MAKSKKGFDSVLFKRKSQLKIFNKIKNLSPKEEILYFEKSAFASPLGGWWKEVSKTKAATAAGSQKKKRSKTAPVKCILCE
jgi:uncharacterized protein YebE (UPF0316 family)